MTRSVLGVLLLAACGPLWVACGEPDNAYLSLHVLFDQARPDVPYARIRFAREGDGQPTEDAVEKLTSGRSRAREIAIEARGAAIAGYLDIDLERCRDSACKRVVGSERIRLVRAFYRDEHTRVELTEGGLAQDEDERVELDACVVEGCGGGCDARGVHACAR